MTVRNFIQEEVNSRKERLDHVHVKFFITIIIIVIVSPVIRTPMTPVPFRRRKFIVKMDGGGGKDRLFLKRLETFT